MSATSAPPNLRLMRSPDVVVVLAAAPILLLIGVPAAGYLVGTAAWILLRVVGLAVDRHATSLSHVVQQASLRLAYRMMRIVLLALAAVVASKAGGNDDGLAALLVIIIAFTIQLTVAIVERPGPR
jgi:hypothetical protein